jgi:hypothetical protein
MSVTLLLMLAGADAAEVVWLAPPAADQAQRVAAAAGATRDGLALIDLRAAATDWTEADAKAYEALTGTLKEVRAYETQLDGELLIMDELAGPIGKIGLVRNDADRTAMFSALAYQGFAVDRFFANTLAKDARGEAYRVEYEGLTVARPWADAVALDPEREVTPYDIAEAPQRVAYGQVMALVKRQLPARLVPADLPAGAELIADGRPLNVGASGSANLVPGRHFIHATLDGRVIARWDLRLAAGQKAEAVVPLSDAVLAAFVDGLAAATAPPEALVPAIHALGDEVWIADPRGELRVWKVRADAVTVVELPKVKATGSSEEDEGGLSLAGGVGGGWLSTGDFLLQSPDPALATKATVNAVAVTFGGGADFDAGPARFGAGVDVAMTLGANHVALYGDGSTRFRAYPYVAAGIKPAQVTLGYAFPHHPTAGLRAVLPVGPIEARVLAWYGLGLDREREGGEPFQGTPLYAISAGVGGRMPL